MIDIIVSLSSILYYHQLYNESKELRFIIYFSIKYYKIKIQYILKYFILLN